MQKLKAQQEERKFDLSKEGLPKGRSFEVSGGFGQDLALARTPADVLKRGSVTVERLGEEKKRYIYIYTEKM